MGRRLPQGLMVVVVGIVLLSTSLAYPSSPQSSRKPVTKLQAIELLENGVSPTRVEELIRAYGITFEVTPEVVTEFLEAGATDDLIKALREVAARPGGAETLVKPNPVPASPAPAPTPPVLLIEPRRRGPKFTSTKSERAQRGRRENSRGC